MSARFLRVAETGRKLFAITVDGVATQAAEGDTLMVALLTSRRRPTRLRVRVLVQIAGSSETSPTKKDALSIEQDRIPDGGRSGFVEPETGEVELPLANAMHQFDA